MQQKFIKINGIRHQFSLWGSPRQPKMFLLHGWMDMGASFAFLAEYLRKNYYCIAPDWRGFGKSAHTPNELGYFFYEYLADAHALLAKLSPDEPVRLVGHSMGGNIASLYAGTFPERVSHLVNVDGFGIQDMRADAGPERMRSWIEVDRRSGFKVYPTLKEVAIRLTGNNPKLTSHQALFLAKHISRKVKGGFQIAADHRHKWPSPYLYQLQNIYPFWSRITAKILNIVAEDSEMNVWMKAENPRAELEKRLSHYPAHAQSVVVKNCRHMVHLEKPQQLADLVLNFMKD